MMPPQPGIPQQQGMRPPMPPHGIFFYIHCVYVYCIYCIKWIFWVYTNLFAEYIAFNSIMHKPTQSIFCVLNLFFRSVWWSSSRHARLPSWWYATIWAGTANGAPLPRWASSTSDGNETSCNVARWPLLILLHPV